MPVTAIVFGNLTASLRLGEQMLKSCKTVEEFNAGLENPMCPRLDTSKYNPQQFGQAKAQLASGEGLGESQQSRAMAGLHPLPQDEGDFDSIEAMIKRAEATVPTGTVQQAQPVTDNPGFKRLAREAEQLKKDLRAARRRDRKDAENSEIARELAQTQAQLAEVQIKLAAVEAGPDAGVLELAKPKVIVERDPVVERELRETKNRLEQAEEAARRATADMEAMHKTMIKATEKSLALEGQLAKVQNTERVFELFGKQILQWRSDAGIVAASVRRNPHLIDLQVEAACKEVATKLVKIAETLADHRAAPSTAASVPAEVRQIAHA